MSDILSEFIDFLFSNGIQPYNSSDIKPTNKRTNYRLHDDPPSKKRGYYKLKIEAGFGFGFAGDYRSDECHAWHSKSATKSDSREIYIMREAARIEAAREAEELKKNQQEKAKEYSNMLLFLDEAPASNPYLKKKGVKACGALGNGGSLIVPMYIGGTLWNYQEIKEDGSKRFQTGALKNGTYFTIKGTKETVYICEGFATGASVYEATGAEVIVAFDAGNLSPVTENIREQEAYKASRIIIAADNDHETRINDVPHNTGLKKANEIQEKYGINYIYPVFQSPEGNTDFNDLHQTEGLGVLKDSIREQLKTVSGSVPAKSMVVSDSQTMSNGGDTSFYDENFEKTLLKTSKGIDRSAKINTLVVCLNDPLLRGVYKYDSFSKNIILAKCPPWADENTFRVRGIEDTDYLPLLAYLETAWNLRPTKSDVNDVIEQVATQEHHTFNPAMDYFNSLEWDGIPRLSGWLKKYVSDGEQSEQYLEMIGTKFMCGLAARAMNPGCKFDTMLILEGKQYAGKSYLSRIMGTIGGEEYFLDDFRDIENKDSLMKMQGKIVVEFPEISTLRKAEVNELKAFVTRQTDEYRVPYGRKIKTSPRQCVFIGTINPEGPYFKDMTGNRRYWPVSCRNKIDIAGLKEVMPHLHAEAAKLVKCDERITYLSDEEYSMAQTEQSKRVIEDMWVDRIEGIVRGKNFVSSDDIASGLGIPMERRHAQTYARISQIMSHAGYKSHRQTVGGRKITGYAKVQSYSETLFTVEEETVNE